MFNIGTVYRFEVIRTLKKRSFWIMALAFPALIAVIGAIAYFSNKTTADVASQLKNEKFTIEITDASHIIKPRVMQTLGIMTTTSKEQGIQAVKDGSIDAYFYYPADISTGQIEVYGKNVGIFNNDRYSSVAKYLLEQSVVKDVTPSVATILQGKTNISTTTYQDGQVYDGLQRAIAPGIFLVLFYFLIAMFGGQMLTSTTEEKENRVIEMILTTVTARTLIIGKILSLISLAFVQGIIFATPIIVGYIFFRDQLSLPAIDLSTLPIDQTRVILGAIIFAASFLLFTGILVLVGAASPTAKEASGFMGVIMALLFAPLYAASLFISSPDTPIVKVLTYFPLTSPIPSLLRNAFGNLSIPEAILVIGILGISAVVAMLLAVRMFRYGAIEYTKKSPLKLLLQK